MEKEADTEVRADGLHSQQQDQGGAGATPSDTGQLYVGEVVQPDTAAAGSTRGALAASRAPTAAGRAATFSGVGIVNDDTVRLSHSYATHEDSERVAGADYATGEVISLTGESFEVAPGPAGNAARRRKIMYMSSGGLCAFFFITLCVLNFVIEPVDQFDGTVAESEESTLPLDGLSPGGLGGLAVDRRPAQAELTFAADFDSIGERGSPTFQSFVSQLVTELSTLLAVQASRLGVLSIRPGSVVVLLEIAPAEDGSSCNGAAELCSVVEPAALMDRLTAVVSEGSIPSVLSLLSTVTDLTAVAQTSEVIGETGTVRIAQQPCGDTDLSMCTDSTAEAGKKLHWTTVPFSRDGRGYHQPVVITGPPTSDRRGSDIVVRVRNVEARSFDIALQAPRCRAANVYHPVERVSWIVVEAGTWYWGEGENRTLIEAGTRGVGECGCDSAFFLCLSLRFHGASSSSSLPFADKAAAIAGTGRDRRRWHRVDFSHEFGSRAAVRYAQTGQEPVVLSQIDSFLENEVGPAWSHVRDLDPRGFEVTIDEDRWDGLHGIEFVGWLAMLEGGRVDEFLASSLVSQASEPAVIEFGSNFLDCCGSADRFTVNVFASITSTEDCCSDREMHCEPDVANIRQMSAASLPPSNTHAQLQVRKVECAENVQLSPDHTNDERIAVLAVRSGLMFGTACQTVDEAELEGARNIDAATCNDDKHCWRDTDYTYVEISSFTGAIAHTLEDDGHVRIPVAAACCCCCCCLLLLLLLLLLLAVLVAPSVDVAPSLPPSLPPSLSLSPPPPLFAAAATAASGGGDGGGGAGAAGAAAAAAAAE